MQYNVMNKILAIIPVLLIVAISGCTTSDAGNGNDGTGSAAWCGTGNYVTLLNDGALPWCDNQLLDDPAWMGAENLEVLGTRICPDGARCHIKYDGSTDWGQWIVNYYSLDEEMNDMWIIQDTYAGVIEQHIIDAECVEGLC